jgi:protocatechuate 3,4-dioxygenase beta subunit
MRHWSRREFLIAGAAVAVAAACRSNEGSDTTDGSGPSSRSSTSTTPGGAAGATSLAAADFDGLAICTLTPEQTAGPFPLDEQFVRRNITEGYAGHPMQLGFRVVDADCTPVPGAAVEVWHTDATGDYSAFADGGGGKDEAEDSTFLRGTQVADDLGIVEFATIYPGWYPGRTPHIHVRVNRDDETVLTSQVYFDEEDTERVYETDPYAEFGSPDTSWADDGIAGDPATEGTALSLSPRGTGTQALLNLGVAI